MMLRARRTTSLCLLAFTLLFAGCHGKKRKTISQPNSPDYSDNIAALTAQPQLSTLKWPNYSDYQPLVKTFYDDRNNEIAWTRDGKPTAQATAFINAFQKAERKGLIPTDYDADRWGARVQALNAKNEDAIAQFDVAMTITVMRFISDLHIGRVNPQHFNFDIDAAEHKYDLPEFISDQAVDAGDVPKLITSVEPDSDQYRATLAGLDKYLDLAQQQQQSGVQPLPPVGKTVAPGQQYAAAAQLQARLALEGDFEGTASTATGTSYTTDLSGAVKSYQHRHGLTEDGKLTQATIDSLNVPLTQRCQQLADSLERWRWLPKDYLNAPLIVNLPEFILHGYTNPGHQEDFEMKVVVGKVVGDHDTPVFAHMMKYLIFRPFWNVPQSIIKKELAPHIHASGIGYLASKNFETVDGTGHPVTASADSVLRGGVIVREKPGPKNSLGLVKFMFPNEYDIYLHSTPATELFNRTRRDFSHGCVRVQEPDKLAAWVLQNQPFQKDPKAPTNPGATNDQADLGSSAESPAGGGNWTLQEVQQAMNNGSDNHQVNLKTPIPIVIFYITAMASQDGHIHFFDDIYHYDQQLENVLAKGQPYPPPPAHIDPKAGSGKDGDTL